MSDDGKQTPKLPPRESDREDVEQPEKQERDYSMLLEALSQVVGFIAELLGGWH